VSNYPVGPCLESSFDQVFFSLRKHEGEGDQTRSGVDYRPLGHAASEWIVEGGRGEGPVTKVERQRLPERSFAQDRRPFSGNKLWAPNCLLYLRYVSAATAAAVADFLLLGNFWRNEFMRTRPVPMVLRAEK